MRGGGCNLEIDGGNHSKVMRGGGCDLEVDGSSGKEEEDEGGSSRGKKRKKMRAAIGVQRDSTKDAEREQGRRKRAAASAMVSPGAPLVEGSDSDAESKDDPPSGGEAEEAATSAWVNGDAGTEMAVRDCYSEGWQHRAVATLLCAGGEEGSSSGRR
ncbi:hypothetical protein B296_00010546 [Ensete ventricosum]|uniref:Uncharacterized protein n=1 Tax=Ensete ventricosum TaxID=4639 RepID=A0A427AQU4_ENSVE|nr:hypothetical protein B296_00010546 [Ensete ventricosum]